MTRRWRQPKERERARGESRHRFLPLSSLPPRPSLPPSPSRWVYAPAPTPRSGAHRRWGSAPHFLLAKFTAPSIPSALKQPKPGKRTAFGLSPPGGLPPRGGLETSPGRRRSSAPVVLNRPLAGAPAGPLGFALGEVAWGPSPGREEWASLEGKPGPPGARACRAGWARGPSLTPKAPARLVTTRGDPCNPT